MRRTSDPAAEAACGYWRRRGLRTAPEQVAVAPGAPLLLLAVLAVTGGGVLLPRPCESWYAAPARLLGRRVHGVPVPAECGGVPDPFALLETVRRAREEEPEPEAPRVLVLSVADGTSGTAAPPELLHEVCEAAAGEGLLVLGDESWRDTLHDPHDTVIVSPVEMLGGSGEEGSAAVLTGLDAALLPPGVHAGAARFSATAAGRALRDGVAGVLESLHAALSPTAAAAVSEALAEPDAVRERRAAGARARGGLAAALHRVVTGAGALCRPPHLGRFLYADLEPVRPRLERRGVRDAAGLEAELVRRLGPFATGGHRFGDERRALRVRLDTDVLVEADVPARGGAGTAEAEPWEGVDSLTLAASPESPTVTRALAAVRSALTELTDGSRD
ncbi:aminotransferase class I/II-fold pyridoxal phosphate-dependent enzyme [Streptomyces sp. ODS28]|uniref:aminotransferase class I/II-fold pyridoxal phosphate-dependent enzyme n=1 Tax=Streptomyces sp. ODS28 TaxID=3136688 RepID=UPI0031E5997A